jgi:hypothetical protein
MTEKLDFPLCCLPRNICVLFSQRKFEQFDDSVLKKIFLCDGPEHDLTRLYEKLCLT